MDRDAALELQRVSLTLFVRMLAAGTESSTLFEREGVVASIVPTAPERSVLNSVIYRDRGALVDAMDELAHAYEEAGVRAWTVWVPEPDRDAVSLLEAAGHRLDTSPTAMVIDLATLGEGEFGELDWDATATLEDVARINDLAYGFDPGTFGTALERLPPELPLRLYQARVDGDPVSVLATMDAGEDCGIYLVATAKEHRGGGLARRLLHAALIEARERGQETSSLQSTKLGYPVYARLGYEPICLIEMWERRK